MPLNWSELKPGLKPGQFNIKNALKRIAGGEDPWAKVLGPPIDLTKCAKTLQKKYSRD
jgi:bifunctional non-homologous end joining protein LigD